MCRTQRQEAAERRDETQVLIHILYSYLSQSFWNRQEYPVREARRGTAAGGIFLLKQDRGSDGSPSIRTKKRSGRTLHTLIHFFVWKRPRYFWSPNTHLWFSEVRLNPTYTNRKQHQNVAKNAPISLGRGFWRLLFGVIHPWELWQTYQNYPSI